MNTRIVRSTSQFANEFSGSIDTDVDSVCVVSSRGFFITTNRYGVFNVSFCILCYRLVNGWPYSEVCWTDSS